MGRDSGTARSVSDARGHDCVGVTRVCWGWVSQLVQDGRTMRHYI